MTRDGVAAVRVSEEFDVPRVDAWLRERVPELGPAGLPDVTQYPGGASNWTYRLRYPARDLVLRRGPSGTKARSAHDMGREFRLQKALRPVFPFVPEMLAFCDDPEVVGAEFYVMERLDGVILRRDPPPGFLTDADVTRRMCLSVLDTLVALHQVDARAGGLEALGKGPGFVDRQVTGWSDRYRKARTWNVPTGGPVMSWLVANRPARERLCVTHNDFRFDNVVLDPKSPSRVIGVLDWELATIGDPWMDLGNSLAYWVEAGDDFLAQRTRRQPTHLPGMLRRREVVAYYAERTGEAEVPRDWTFYEVFGLFRLSVIAQQIYLRYHRRETRNSAFRHFWLWVHYLQWRCRRAIRTAAAG